MAKLRYIKIDDDSGSTIIKNKALKGVAPKFQLLRYKATLGDGSFVLDGTIPICAICDSVKLVPCIEIDQLMLGDGHDISLVMQCGDCGQHTVFKYELWGNGDV